MAGVDSGHGTDDTAAQQAAEVAVELTEAGGPADKRRTAKKLRAVADRAAGAVTNAAVSAGHLPRRRSPVPADEELAGKSLPDRQERWPRIGKIAGSAGRSANAASRTVASGMSWMSAQVVAMGPRLRIRDQATLRKRFPGQTDDQIAQRLIERAARASATVGGTTGAWAALPALPAFPVEVAAETLAVVGIEIKLVAELHEVYGMAATGTGSERARAYIGSWAARRGVYLVDGSLLLIAGSPLAKQLTRRLAARVRRSTFALAPLFTGAVAGAVLNRRETRRLGREILDDLRQRLVARPTARSTIVSGAQAGYISQGDDLPYPPYPPQQGR
jgi:hypothetical protein